MNINDYSIVELRAEMMNRKIKPLSEMTDQEIESVIVQKEAEFDKEKDKIYKQLTEESGKKYAAYLKFAEANIKAIDEIANRPSIFSRLFMKIKGDKNND